MGFMGTLEKYVWKWVKRPLFLAGSTVALGTGGLAALGTGILFEEQFGTGKLQRALGETTYKIDRNEKLSSAEEIFFAPFVRTLYLPDLEEVLKQKYERAGKNNFNINLYDKENRLFCTERNLEERLGAEQISPLVFYALKAAEDRTFEEHQGWNPGRAIKALWGYNIAKTHREMQGASTITIQLADLLIEDPCDCEKLGGEGKRCNPVEKQDCSQHRYFFKAREWVYATEIEKKFSKGEIAVHYLNIASFGNAKVYKDMPITGIAAAARYYFNKEAFDLGLQESIILVSMLNSPGRFGTAVYNKLMYGSNEERQVSMKKLLKRCRYVLAGIQEMIQEERIDPLDLPEEERLDAMRVFNYDYVSFFPNESCVRENTCEYMDAVLESMKTVMADKGMTKPLENAQIDVYTNFNPSLQQMAREKFRVRLEEVRKRFPEEQRKRISGALVIADLEKGLEALVNGFGRIGNDDRNRGLERYAQAGSAFKPFVLAAVLQSGKHLSDTIKDVHYCYQMNGSQKYCPENYGGHYSGKEVMLLDGLVKSKNNLAVEQLHQLAQEKGASYAVGVFNRFFPGYFSELNLSYALGAKEIGLIDLAGAYATFALQGIGKYYPDGKLNISPVRALAVNGMRVDYAPRVQLVVSPAVARDVDYALMRVVAEGTGKAAQLAGYEVHGKTGTAKDAVVFVGYVPEIKKLVGVLFASDWPEKTQFPHSLTGGNSAAYLFKDVVAELVKEKPML